MSENPFIGVWSATKQGKLEGLQDLTIEPGPEGFTINAPSLDIHLPGLSYDAEEDMLVGCCQGRVRGDEGLFNVAVMQYGQAPHLHCKGVIFSADGRVREDNSVGSWTADKKGPIDPPER